MSSFISGASKRVTDVRGFLRDAAGGTGIKYSGEKGTRHQIFFISRDEDEVVDGVTTTKSTLDAYSGAVHEWMTTDGKFKSVVCMKDVVRKAPDGSVLNDGSCPFCDRVGDAWEIYNYRKDMEESKCKLTGDDRKKYLEKTIGTIADERKAKTAHTYMYALVAQFRLGPDNNPVIGTDGNPEYDIKVMKLSSSRVVKLQQQIANSGCELPDSEVIFEYPNVDDRRLLVSQSTTTPVFPNNKITVRYPNVLTKIKQDAAKFDWDSIYKAFNEWAGMTVTNAKTLMDNAFEKWDEYKRNLEINPEAKYLEYSNDTSVSQPSIGGFGAPVVPGAALGAPVIPGVVVPGAPVPGTNPVVPGATVPGAAPVVPGIVPPAVPNTDPNAVFGGTGNITI